MKVDPVLDRAVTRGLAAGTRYSLYPSQAAMAGETVVLIHGVGMNHSVWAPQIDALTQHYQVVAYDMLGHGESRLPTATPTLGEYAAQLEGLLDALQVERVHVVGHSMGALVSLEFALLHPQRTLSVAALNAVYNRTPGQRAAVMSRAAMLGLSPRTPRAPGTQAGPEGGGDTGVDATLARWFGDPVPPHLAEAAEAIRALLVNVDPVGYARTYQLFACSDDAHVGRLADLAVPALFLTGECDANSNPVMSHAMAAAAPLGHAAIIANARHMMNVTHPAQVNERLLEFLLDTSKAGANGDQRSDIRRMQ
ncbi:alpha/beta fold hydrolase [Paraburkholderia kururiensis]|uniref:Alpha/beta fold hydrolase n=1 Tax=Paraburkholderia kururiensis TaxID=984307 RepID=A0ABZ0WR86_9BURK|nr:alpha/beta fold hydrolase [Paraburkholderia kururiensis]WQD79877.1 alpha/beta fold hydrolase [Paraburkholderia kururiensis]